MQVHFKPTWLRPFRQRCLFGALAVVAAWQLCAGAAQANEIDQKLKKHAQGALVSAVEEAKYKNVGVLPFEVQFGDKNPSFHRGDLNKLMATRLGNMLILANVLKDANDAFGVVTDAGLQAQAQAAKTDKKAKATWRTAEERAKLFTYAYTRAWEDAGKPNAPVKIDAFVTGLVKVPKDPKKESTVIVQLFDKTSKELRTIAEFPVPTETSTLADMHLAYKVEIRDLKDLSKKQVDIVEGPGAEDKDPNKKPKPTTAPYSDYLDFKVFYDDKEVEIANGKLPNPEAGTKKIHFKMTNKNEQTGVVILVNGVNTLGDERDREPEAYSRWVLEANKTYGVYGFYPDDKTVKAFVEGKNEEAQEGDFVPSQAYKIQIIVFKSVPAGDSDIAKVDKAHLRTVVATSATGGKLGIRDLHIKLLAGPKLQGRDMILPGPGAPATLETDTFNGVIVANSVLWYGKAASDEN
jgi:hypothetical protein